MEPHIQVFTLRTSESGMTSPNTPRPELGGRTPEQQAENESFGGKGCLAIIVAVCLGLAVWAILIWIGEHLVS